MFLFIGVVMAAAQGGVVRRVRPGSELLFALIVRHSFSDDISVVGS